MQNSTNNGYYRSRPINLKVSFYLPPPQKKEGRKKEKEPMRLDWYSLNNCQVMPWEEMT